MGGLAAKTFPWPTAIGNSQNVSPLTQSVAPMKNGPATQLSATSSPAASVSGTPPGTTVPTMPSAPSNPLLPVGQPQPYLPITGRYSAPSPAFYGR